MAGITHLYPGGAATTSTTTAPSGTTTTTILTPGGPCPAAYALGQDHPRLEQLRAFRDGPLAHSAVGRRIIRIYYDNAGSITVALERSPALRSAARELFAAAALLMADKHLTVSHHRPHWPPIEKSVVSGHLCDQYFWADGS